MHLGLCFDLEGLGGTPRKGSFTGLMGGHSLEDIMLCCWVRAPDPSSYLLGLVWGTWELWLPPAKQYKGSRTSIPPLLYESQPNAMCPCLSSSSSQPQHNPTSLEAQAKAPAKLPGLLWYKHALCWCLGLVNFSAEAGCKAADSNILNHFREPSQSLFVRAWGLQLNIIFPEQKASVLHENTGDILKCNHEVQDRNHCCFYIHKPQGNLPDFPKVPGIWTLRDSCACTDCPLLHAFPWNRHKALLDPAVLKMLGGKKKGEDEYKGCGGQGEEWLSVKVLGNVTSQ